MGILVAAVLPLPYSYYMFLRWAVTLSAGLHLALAVQSKLWGVAAVCAGIAILFNPLAPVYLTKGIWAALDIAAAALFGYASAMLSKPPESTER
ncbi:MAG TPA: hypothetical protein PLW86_07570 [Rhodocyclaceae bacterium]|nr:hypothetical protein [Rhodocyclaceae bacterium]